MSGTSAPSPELQKAFAAFLEYTPPARLARSLRNLLLLYLEHENGMLPASLRDLLPDLNNLFELLDAAAEECK